MGPHKITARLPLGGRVRIVCNGEGYVGTFTVDGPLVSVETLLLGSRRAQLKGCAPEVVATRLLFELVYEGQKRKRASAL
jgi:hypothetical protein